MTVVSVSGDTAHVVFNGLSLFHQAVEQGGFAHIGSAYNCYYICHDLRGVVPEFF